MGSSLTAIYIITGIIAISVGLILHQLARLSARPKDDKRLGEAASFPLDANSNAFKNTVSNEISYLVDSKEQKEKISRTGIDRGGCSEFHEKTRCHRFQWNRCLGN